MTKFNSEWIEIVKKLAITFRFTPYERKALLNNKVAKLIGSVPFLAGCENPERTAVSHVAIYLVAKHPVMRCIYDHGPNDDSDVMHRLFDISHFIRGNKKIIERGMELLLLTMISNYQKDQTADAILGKYNPIAKKKWKYQPTADLLIEKIKSNSCPEMDEIFCLENGTEGWWDPLKQDEGIRSSKNEMKSN